MAAPCRICGEESILNECGVCCICQTYRPTHNRFGEKTCHHGRTKDQECPHCQHIK